MKKKELIAELRLNNAIMRRTIDRLTTRIRNLKERVNRHNERNEELESQVRNLQSRLSHQSVRIKSLESELGGCRMVELDMSLTEDEQKVYEEGMEILDSEGEMTQEDIDLINNGRELTEDEIAFLHSLPAIPITRQEVKEIVLEVIKEVIGQGDFVLSCPISL